MMDLFRKFIDNNKNNLKQFRYLVAVSGGVDSVVLCDLLSKASIDFVIAHCNFQLRAEESERDERFVRDLAEKYSKEFFVKRFNTAQYAEEKKLSIQVAARDLRYSWFRSIAFGEKKADFIMTAHHADDNIETVVMNFFRGTGLKGLIGMDAEFSLIYRPLLSFRKQDILEYARQNNLQYVEDSSNASSNYTRNYFRNDLLPAISKVFPAVEENILKNIKRLTEVEQVYNGAIEIYKSKLIETKGQEEHIPILKLKKIPFHKTLTWEIIKDKYFTAGQVDEVIKLMDADNGSFIESEFYRIIKNRKWLIITQRNMDTENVHVLLTETDKKKSFSLGKLETEKDIPGEAITISTDKSVALFDAAELSFPLILRKWKQGDYFYPLGMRKKKKLSKFFIDQKLSLIEKEKMWVLESNMRIVWVIGQRIDDRFKITSSTKSAIRITLKESRGD
jgi:tRNA(Ile)-lysidine synthase